MNKIKIADFEAEYNNLYNSIEELQHTPKTAVLALLREFKSNIMAHGYEPREIKIPSFLEVR